MLIDRLLITLSIIIPTLNEAQNLGETLNSLGNQHEIIVVDGGSGDSTLQIAESHGARLVKSGIANRAVQLNKGAGAATGEMLLFLHADTQVQSGTIENLLQRCEKDGAIVGGGFHRYFDSTSPVLKVTCFLANLRSSWFGIFLGDQGIFVRKSVFEQLGGFREDLGFGEDLDLSLRLKSVGNLIAVKPAVLSSPRRFEKSGAIRQTFTDLRLTFQIIRRRKAKS